MSFFVELFHRIILFFKEKKNVDTVIFHPEEDAYFSDYYRLVILACALNVPEKVIKKIFPTSKITDRYFALINMGLRSNEKRLLVFDTESMAVEKYYVAHGKNSDKGPGNTGWATKFSNVPESHQTSLGLYKCSEEYKSAKFGRAMRLDGLEETNSNARKRAIVLHGSSYVESNYVFKNGVAGRSQGCPAVGYEYRDRIIDCLSNGRKLFIYKEGENI